jgi:hypothetical protein
LPAERHKIALAAEGLLMSRVDAATRHRWLEDAAKVGSGTKDLLGHWARWDFSAAWGVALATKDLELLREVFNEALFPDSWEPHNLQRVRLRQIVESINNHAFPPDVFRLLMQDEFVLLLEVWGEIHLGDTARHGLDLLVKSNEVPRDELLRLFSGDNSVGGDGDVLDRTFCALRIWAVTKPGEMRAWLATMKDKEMRTALTWLLENPWGTGSAE